ncbi:MAG: hypothetical protein KGL92_05530 [Gammaproteobacteria bacterium]|nr:hypothetical protein [Gammaproteobacteria bacterium]MDE2347944.1 hypothetical protein [Gammaproteobacteria bacterium]
MNMRKSTLALTNTGTRTITVVTALGASVATLVRNAASYVGGLEPVRGALYNGYIGAYAEFYRREYARRREEDETHPVMAADRATCSPLARTTKPAQRLN